MKADIPSPDRLHWAVMEFFRAGDAYRRAYRTAFVFDSANAVRNMKANMVIMTARTDVLDRYHEKMPTPPANVQTLRPKDMVEAKTMFTEILRKHASGKAPPIARTEPRSGKIWAEYLPVDGGSLYARRNTDGRGRPIVFIHASAASSFSMDRYMTPFIGKRPVLAVDLPGNGESDNPMGKKVTVDAQARYLAQAIKAAGYSDVDVFGHWGGGSVGVELAVQNPALVKSLAVPTLMVTDPAYRDDLLANYTPAIVPDEVGGHLLKVWHMVRDQELFSPWYKRKKENAIAPHPEDIDPVVIHRRTVDLFKAIDIYQAAYAAHFTYPALERIAKTTCPVLLGDPMYDGAKKALAAVGSRGVAGKSLAEFFV
jgi:pimeloyl-ACP methyl ester carboxylesterase